MIIKKITSKQDGLKLEIAIMECKNPKGIVQFSHGMAEHKERYFDFMQYLNERGYICVIHDHRGHGGSVKSKNDYGYFYTENADYIVDDLFQVTEYIRDMYPGLEVTLFSHSMGTLVARCYLKKYDEYKETQKRIEDAKALINDPEMHDLAEMELDEATESLKTITHELEILLIPKDENDGKNIIMEIRGAAGGDEANIFAGDLFRMYSRYAEKQGWKIEVTNEVEGTAGGYSQIEFMIKI